jgi:hypothetical protein
MIIRGQMIIVSVIRMFEMWMIINFLFTLLHIYSSHEVVVAYNCGSHTNVSTKYVKYLSVSLIMIEGRNV